MKTYIVTRKYPSYSFWEFSYNSKAYHTAFKFLVGYLGIEDSYFTDATQTELMPEAVRTKAMMIMTALEGQDQTFLDAETLATINKVEFTQHGYKFDYEWMFDGAPYTVKEGY